jgi:hypothetical protein
MPYIRGHVPFHGDIARDRDIAIEGLVSKIPGRARDGFDVKVRIYHHGTTFLDGDETAGPDRELGFYRNYNKNELEYQDTN